MRTGNKQVLVVGGAGYIGSHLVLELVRLGHSVTVFDDLSTGHLDNLPEDVHFVQADLMQPGELEQLLEMASYDAVIHLAALKAAGDSMTDPENYGERNIWGTMRLLHACADAGIDKIVFSSTAAVYGDPEYQPIDESHPCQPSNFYGYTKLAIERHLEWFDRLRGIRFVSLRYFNAAGYDAAGRISGLEVQPRNLIPVIMEVAKGWREALAIFGNDYPTPDGTCIRDYIHVTDLAAAHGLALNHLFEGNASLCCNLGTGQGYSVREVVSAASEVCGFEIAHRVTGRRAGDPPELVASAKMAKTALGWEPRHSSLTNILLTSWQVYSKVSQPPES